MKSMIKFLLFFLAIVLVITWLVTMYKSGNNEMELTDTQVEQQAVMQEEEVLDEEVLQTMNEEDLEEEYKTILEDTEPTEEELRAEEQVEEQAVAIEKEEVEKVVPTQKPVENEVVENNSSNSNQSNSTTMSEEIQPYMVIVGSFLVPNNADKKKNVVNNLGFDGEVVNFNLSQYHTVLAGRYDTYDEAQSTVNKLKAKGVDAYTKRREK